jgi:hypothetical protein
VGELLQDWNQNSSPQDFINITNHFILCLLQRGHLLKDLIPILQSAVSTIDNSLNCRQRSYAEHKQDEALYIHWQFHPRDFDKAKICQIYNKTLKGHENFTQMWIAMSRPKNLRDILCRTNIPAISNNNASDILQKLQDNSESNEDTAGTY